MFLQNPQRLEKLQNVLAPLALIWLVFQNVILLWQCFWCNSASVKLCIVQNKARIGAMLGAHPARCMCLNWRCVVAKLRSLAPTALLTSLFGNDDFDCVSDYYVDFTKHLLRVTFEFFLEIDWEWNELDIMLSKTNLEVKISLGQVMLWTSLFE